MTFLIRLLTWKRLWAAYDRLPEPWRLLVFVAVLGILLAGEALVLHTPYPGAGVVIALAACAVIWSRILHLQP